MQNLAVLQCRQRCCNEREVSRLWPASLHEEAHRKLNERLTAIMEDTLVWERALSLRNPWIQQMAQYKAPEELDRNFVKKYIEQVIVTLLENGQAKISLTMKTYEWKKMLGRIEMEGTDDGTKE